MFNNEFYPTPKRIIGEMLKYFSVDKHTRILEPSAGKGDIIDEIMKHGEMSKYRFNPYIDVIEIEDDLRSILKDKPVNLVGRDFLNTKTYKRYDLIIMNPPFSNGDDHLIHAMDIMENGGRIICLLNSETIKNPYSNKRKALATKLKLLNANIEFIENGFIDAERKTNVEVAIVVVDIPKPKKESFIVRDLLKAKEIETKERIDAGEIITANPIDNMIDRYNFEMRAGIRLIKEYHSMSYCVMNSFDEGMYNSEIIELKVGEFKNDEVTDINNFASKLRYKYWYSLLGLKEFQDYMTNEMRNDYIDQVDKLSEAEFNKENIYDIRLELMKHLSMSIENSVYGLFREFTDKHSYYKDCNQNIHYYNGWKTNIAHKVNDKKVILPNCTVYDTKYGGLSTYRVEQKLMEIERCLNYISSGRTDSNLSIRDVIDEVEETEITKNVEFKYFYVDFYKKGTAHLKWKDKEVIRLLNIYGGKKENGLPPYYGDLSYDDLSEEDKEIVNEFEGKKEYINRFNDDSIKLFDSNNLLKLM